MKSAREFSVHSGASEFDEEQCNEDHVEFLNLSTILSNYPQSSQLPRGVLQIFLPPHSKCVLATCQIYVVLWIKLLDKITDPTFNAIMKNVETKVTKLCNNAQSFSDNTSKMIRMELGVLFREEKRHKVEFRIHLRVHQSSSECIILPQIRKRNNSN